ncbi:MAG: hypothetical protein IT495_16140 [Gammaproteobacteria bacterium]|nr:hypothetical protein [Gammaproteobacteria bacterium]
MGQAIQQLNSHSQAVTPSAYRAVSYALRKPAREGPDGFIHHPPGFPLQFRRMWLETLRGEGHPPRGSLGLAFHSTRFVRPGTRLEISIPLRGETQRFRGEVVLIRARDDDYEIGVWLDSDADAARARIVEQICHIECYLRSRHGSDGDARPGQRERAAREWITKFAAGFPVF